MPSGLFLALLCHVFRYHLINKSYGWYFCWLLFPLAVPWNLREVSFVLAAMKLGNRTCFSPFLWLLSILLKAEPCSGYLRSQELQAFFYFSPKFFSSQAVAFGTIWVVTSQRYLFCCLIKKKIKMHRFTIAKWCGNGSLYWLFIGSTLKCFAWKMLSKCFLFFAFISALPALKCSLKDFWEL